MRDGNAELGGGQRACERGVDVPADDNEVGTLLGEDALECDQREPRLLAVRARADAEEAIGLREAEVVEDLRGHPLVVVLARVHDEPAKAVAAAGGVDDGRHLDEVRPGSDGEDDCAHEAWHPG
jgi:hypothetical protein